jgi:hypothetical protein
VEKYRRAGQYTDGNVAHGHCIPKVTNSHSEYVVLFAFPLQHESASMIRYTLPVLPVFSDD